jgi:hypothetical protein
VSAQTTELPVLYQYCRDVYDKMLAQAFKVGGRDGSDGYEPEMIVYEGRLTDLITKEMHLSVPYYTHTMRELKRMGCVRQLRRGGGTSPSQWEMLHEPTPELWYADSGPIRQSQSDEKAILNQQIRGLSARVTALTEAVETLSAHVSAHDRQLQQLARKRGA